MHYKPPKERGSAGA
jgi:hypothetical protein